MNENFDITYKALFRRYYPNLIFYATRLVGEEEAEDVVQDVFVELWKRKRHHRDRRSDPSLSLSCRLHPCSQRPETSQCGRRLLRRHGRNQPKACRILSTGQQRSDPED